LKSRVTDDFVACFARLPASVKDKARKNYRLWRLNPNHPSLHFKRIHHREPLFSVRVGIGWRALGLLESDVVNWFWIGSHAEYNKLVKQLRG
jgi:hypothetical protein